MQSVPEDPTLIPSLSLDDISPRSLLSGKRTRLREIYYSLQNEASAPPVKREVEMLWCVFDAALDSNNSDFIINYLDGSTNLYLNVVYILVSDICFSPDILPFSADGYFHNAQLIFDWCQKCHGDMEIQILEQSQFLVHRISIKCDQMIKILNHCKSYRGGNKDRRDKRDEKIKKLIDETNGIKLVAGVTEGSLSGEFGGNPRSDMTALPPDIYLASQQLPPTWMTHYPFPDDAKLIETVFLHKEDQQTDYSEIAKLAVLGFYLLHSGRVSSLDFLVTKFGMDRSVVSLWEGIFLVDLASFDRLFSNEAVLDQAISSLKTAMSIDVILPLETLTKLNSFGRAEDAKILFLWHLERYLNSIPNPISLIRQGLVFCLASGDLESGLKVIRDSLGRLSRANDGILLLRHFYDQVLGSGRLEQLILLDLTGLEEAVFIEWAGNKRDDPECSLYLSLYFLKVDKTDSTRKLYILNKPKIQYSMNKELWEQIGEVLRALPPARLPDSTSPQPESLDAMEEDRSNPDDDLPTLLSGCRGALPFHFPLLLNRAAHHTGPQLLPSTSISTHFLCPLNPLTRTEKRDTPSTWQTSEIQEALAEEFYDPMVSTL